MAYTIDHLYKKFLESTDKMGGDFYTIPYMMNRLESSTHDFIGETVKFFENTQEIRDDIRPLYKPLNLPVIQDPNDVNFVVATLPNDYYHLIDAQVKEPGIVVRKTNIIRHGQKEIYFADPNKKPEKEYPIIVIYDTYIRIYTPGTPNQITGFYLKKPTFGDYNAPDLTVEVAVNLPEYAVDKILKNIVSETLIAIGDPRASVQYQDKENYRKRR